jgi:hypothetical protein
LDADDVREAFIKPILKRFKGRAHIGYVGREEEYSHVYQWGMWIEEDMVMQFQNQELPLFEDSVFDAFADFEFTTRLPLFAYDYDLLREKLEASAAAIQVTPKSDRSFSISMPALKTAKDYYTPEPSRFQYVTRLLTRWNGECKGFARLTPDSLLERRMKTESPVVRAKMLRNSGWSLDKAETAFVQAKVIGAQAIQHVTFPLSEAEAFAYLGTPHRTIQKDSQDVRVYQHRMGDALFLSEVSNGKIDLYHFPGKGASHIQFERFHQEISG